MKKSKVLSVASDEDPKTASGVYRAFRDPDVFRGSVRVTAAFDVSE
jgi:hypothetical protein